MMTIHTSGGGAMMARAAPRRPRNRPNGHAAPILLGVTVLTSLTNDDLRSIGMAPDTSAQVLRLAALAKASGMSGVVCSAQEIEIVRKEVGPDFLIVTPGIRPAGAAVQDQKRVMTPALAVEKGSDYLVVGRPITQSASRERHFRRLWTNYRAETAPTAKIAPRMKPTTSISTTTTMQQTTR